jgi:hypothetical protein
VILLQEGRFVQLEETEAFKAGQQKPPLVHVKRKSGSDRTIVFEVIDQEPRKGSTRWERVVAVICSGKLWQFKKYPFQACFISMSWMSLMSGSSSDVRALTEGMKIHCRGPQRETLWKPFQAFAGSTSTTLIVMCRRQ